MTKAKVCHDDGLLCPQPIIAPATPSENWIVTMQYQVLLQKPSAQHFVASIVGMPNVTADGKTEQEAIAKIKSALKAQLAMAKFVTIDIEPEPEHKAEDARPLPKSIGIAQSDRTDLSERVDELLWQA